MSAPDDNLLGCDCYGGCWADHSAGWRSLRVLNEEDILAEDDVHTQARIWVRDHLTYGATVFMGDGEIRFARQGDMEAFLDQAGLCGWTFSHVRPAAPEKGLKPDQPAPVPAERFKSAECLSGHHHCPVEHCGCLCHEELTDSMAAIVDEVPEEGAEPAQDREATLQEELAQLLNRHSAENDSDTPDFVLAEYLIGCLETFNNAVDHRERWYGRTTITEPDELVEAMDEAAEEG